jgi:hypothetical protein
MTLREAARRTARSVTTLRRSIRGGRLQATKRRGRFGPEYFVTADQLRTAGFHLPGPDAGERAPARAASSVALDAARMELVPVSLYRELQMKHEQLLVQYGMVRAAGLRHMELQEELESSALRLDDAESRLRIAEQRSDENLARLRRELREAQLEREGQLLEIAALREKVRSLEMLTRNAAMTEDIDRQYREIVEQTRRVDQLVCDLTGDRPSDPGRPEPEH